jgi:hypothetical protein
MTGQIEKECKINAPIYLVSEVRNNTYDELGQEFIHLQKKILHGRHPTLKTIHFQVIQQNLLISTQPFKVAGEVKI